MSRDKRGNRTQEVDGWSPFSFTKKKSVMSATDAAALFRFATNLPTSVRVLPLNRDAKYGNPHDARTAAPRTQHKLVTCATKRADPLPSGSDCGAGVAW